MGFFEAIWQTIVDSFSGLGQSVVNFLPGLVAAIVILIVGLVVSGWLANLGQRLIEILKIDGLIARLPIIEKLNRTGTKVSLSRIVHWLIRWFIVLVTLIAVADILQLSAFNQFLNKIALYFPNVVIAVLILVAGLVLGNGVSDLIRKLIASSELKVGGMVATLAQWAIVIFSIMAALIQLQIASSLINTLFTGIVFMLALAGGLSFGLGSKDAAGNFINKMREQLRG